MRFEFVPIKPMSVNEAWRGRRYKTAKYLRYQEAVMYLLPRNFTMPPPPYKITYEFGFSSKGADLGNPEKMITDILSKKYNFNDNQVYEMILRKRIVGKGKEYIKWRIEHLEM